MGYSEGKNLKYETASKLGHVSIIEDEFIKQLVEEFEVIEDDEEKIEIDNVEKLKKTNNENIKSIIAIDGSLSLIQNSFNNKKIMAYIKIASMILDLDTLEEANKPIVDPNLITEILTNHSDTYSTVIPINNIRVKGHTILESFRKIVDITLRKYDSGILYDTYKFLVYREWKEDKNVIEFQCPSCGEKIHFSNGEEEKLCVNCNNKVYLTDYLGLHRDMNEENNNESLANSFMLVLEHLLLISFIKELYFKQKKILENVLFIKDGPLALYSQYVRLVDPIREFFKYIKNNEINFYVVGIEKSGTFVEHSQLVNKKLKEIGDYFIPDNKYIFSNIKYGDENETKYGERVLYGSKVFVKIENEETIVLTVPTGEYFENPQKENLYGLNTIIENIVKMKSRQFDGALLPIVAINKIASMSVYPSNDILKKFTQDILKRNI